LLAEEAAKPFISGDESSIVENPATHRVSSTYIEVDDDTIIYNRPTFQHYKACIILFMEKYFMA
jgi:hypothetical protein